MIAFIGLVLFAFVVAVTTLMLLLKLADYTNKHPVLLGRISYYFKSSKGGYSRYKKGNFYHDDELYQSHQPKARRTNKKLNLGKESVTGKELKFIGNLPFRMLGSS